VEVGVQHAVPLHRTTPMIVLYRCPHCFRECRANPKSKHATVCRACGRAQNLWFTPTEVARNEVDVCAICRRQDFYVRDDIRKGLGFLYLLGGLLLAYPSYGISLVPAGLGFYWHSVRYPRLTVCYHCYAKYRNVRRNPSHREYDPEMFDRLEKQIRNDRSFPQSR